MKSFVHHHLLLPLLLLLSSCLLFSPAPAASQERTAILDSDGHPVFSGKQYYLTALPNNYSPGTTSPNGDCPLNVFLQTWRYGPPVMLFPEVSTDLGNVVHIGQAVSVMFAAGPPSPCADSTQWKLNPKTGLVTTGGALSNSSLSFSRFQVVKSDVIGKGIRYSFWSTPSPSVQWHKLGVVGDEKLLGESSEPLEFQFIKVPKEPRGSAAALHSTA